MDNKQLSDLIRGAAKKQGINGVMAMTSISPVSYEKTRKVWDGVTTAKISDYIAVMGVLGYELKFIRKGV